MTCAHGGWLHLFWLLPLLVAVPWWAARRRRRDLTTLFGDRVRELVPPGLELRRAWVVTLVVLALCSFVVAAAQPQWGFTWRDLESRGVEVVIALDVSRSMDAEDVHPSRLDRAKHEIADLVAELPGDRVGLVIFAAGAYPRVPLTTDYEALSTLVDVTETGTLLAQGSSLESAVTVALDMLGEPGEADQAIIVISDGEDHAEGLDAVIQAATDAGVRVYTMGVGTDAGAPVPLAKGGFVSHQGDVVVSRLEESALKSLAAGTGGAYIRSSAGAADNRSLAADLHSALTRQAVEVKREKVPDERFQWAIGLGIVLLTLAGLTGDGRRRALGVAALLLLAPVVRAADLEPVERLMAEGRHADAVEELRRLQVAEPLDPDIAWQLAMARYGAGDAVGAAREFESLAERSSDEDLRRDALYNAGNARYRAGELDRAVKSWQDALALDADHGPSQANAERVQQEIQRRLSPPQEQPQQGNSDEGESGEGEPQQGGDTGAPGEPGEGEPGEPGDGERDASSSEGSASDTGQPGAPSGELLEAMADGEPQEPAESAPITPYGVEDMSEDEARKLLDGVEEGTPRVVVRGQSAGKDW